MHPVVAYSVLHGFAQDNLKRRHFIDWSLPACGKTPIPEERMLTRMLKVWRSKVCTV